MHSLQRLRLKWRWTSVAIIVKTEISTANAFFLDNLSMLWSFRNRVVPAYNEATVFLDINFQSLPISRYLCTADGSANPLEGLA